MSTVILSHGARDLEHNMRRCKRVPGGGGWIRVGRRRLAGFVDRGVRSTSRYLAELVKAGIVEVRPPLRVFEDGRWRSVGTNMYRFLVPARRPREPQDRRKPRSYRGVISDTSPTSWVVGRRPNGAGGKIPTSTQAQRDASAARVAAKIASGEIKDPRVAWRERQQC